MSYNHRTSSLLRLLFLWLTTSVPTLKSDLLVFSPPPKHYTLNWSDLLQRGHTKKRVINLPSALCRWYNKKYKSFSPVHYDTGKMTEWSNYIVSSTRTLTSGRGRRRTSKRLRTQSTHKSRHYFPRPKNTSYRGSRPTSVTLDYPPGRTGQPKAGWLVREKLKYR